MTGIHCQISLKEFEEEISQQGCYLDKKSNETCSYQTPLFAPEGNTNW